MRPLLISLVGLIALSHPALAGDDNPRSKKTVWRIPPNATVTAVGIDLKWDSIEHSDGGLSLQAGLAEHHSYEQAWAYYAKIIGVETRYNATDKQQEQIIGGDKRKVIEHDRDQVLRAGRMATMWGKFGRYRTTLTLFDDPTLNHTHRVYVNIIFTPE